MGMLDSINPVKGIVAYGLGLALAASLAYNGWQAFEAVSLGRDLAEVKTQLAAADADAQRIAKETAQANEKTTQQVADLSTQLQASKDQQEKINAENRRLSASAADALRVRSRSGGGAGLFDPYAKAPGACSPQAGAPADPGGAAAGAGDAATAPRLLSEPFERDLVGIAYDAERISLAYSACRAYALDLRDRLQPSQTGESHADPDHPPDPH